jgi:hypothetical protein
MRTDNFKIILEILSAIEAQMDAEQIDWKIFSAEALGASEPRWLKLMDMMNDEGLVKGFSHTQRPAGVALEIRSLRLTLAGLEYLRYSARR